MKPACGRRTLILCALLAQTLLNSAQPHAQGPQSTRSTPPDAQMQRLYGEPQARAFWTEANWAIAETFLANAAADGLAPARYRPAQSPEPLARDRMRTAAVLAYARDLRLGRAELRALDRDILLPEQSYDAAAALLAARDAGGLAAFFADLPPPASEYRQLRLALARYRAIEAAGGWANLDSAALPDAVQKRIALEYPSLAGETADAALKRFQEWHGLAADGVLSRATLAALNIAPGARAAQIETNMERWRWLPRPLEASHIMVNVPAATLALAKEGRTVLTSRVIVGRPATPTPILRADGIAVTVNPPWTVPRSIAVNEMLPKLKRNPAWLRTQNIILLNGPAGDPHGVTVNWRAITAATFPYRLQQLPGPGNALGLIKLELPNRFDVYLHDTPGKAAFAGSQRALSHGCVRVEQILPLAARALAPDADAGRITEAIAAGKTRTLQLPGALPVYFLYWTAMADAHGEVRFWPDIYGRDRRMLLKLRGPAPQLRLAEQDVKCATG